MSDFLITDHGSIIAIVPLTPAAIEWIDENVASEPWQWLGGILWSTRTMPAISLTRSPRPV